MNRRILVVEDSRTQAKALHALLVRHGYEVDLVESGDEALRRARAVRFGLILSDILMPGMSGYELCRRIKDDPDAFGTPPVVLLTSLGDPVDIVRGLESGADNYLTKPYEPGRLISRIEQILGDHAARREQTSEGGVALRFLGESFTIRARREQILDFFLSSYEELIETNRALEESKQTLHRTLAREQAARHAAEAATAARDRVLATVTHDLRNPLNTILMSAALILDQEDSDLDPRVRGRIDVIRKLTHQMNRLIQDLLDVATAEGGRLALRPAPQDTAALVREGLEMLEPIAAERGIRIVLRVPEGLPRISVDRSRILQVVSNLVGNAIKFTPAGGTVTMAARIEDGAIVYTVSDTGPGIAPEDLPRIFDRFWKSHKSGDSGRTGAGLGLSIARDVVEAHGGRIWAESESGKGAAFHFSIPIVQAGQPA